MITFLSGWGVFMGGLNTMCSVSVNTACNNALFSSQTIDGMSRQHPSIQRLYAAASEHDDTAPSTVARRMNVSAQTLNNWETRGISEKGALIAQACYGVDANWLLAGTHHEASRMAPQLNSHSMRLSPAMVAETHRALRELEAAEGRTFDIEKDPVRFVQVYELRCSMSDQPTQDEWIKFGAKLSAIRPPQGATRNGRDDGVPTQGTDAGRVAAGVRRKAGSQGSRR